MEHRVSQGGAEVNRRRKTSPRLAAGLALMLATGLITGCADTAATPQETTPASTTSSATPQASISIPEVVSEAVLALQQAGSVRARRVMMGASAEAPTSTISSIITEGAADDSSYVIYAATPSAVQYTVMYLDGAVYLNGNEAYWAVHEGTSSLKIRAMNRWLTGPTMGLPEGFGQYKPSAFIGQQITDLQSEQFTTVETGTTADGLSVYRLTNELGAQVMLDAATMLPIYVQVVYRQTDAVEFSLWNEVAPPTLPPEEQLARV